ncbi:hypothetical protein EV421DRAFT_1715869, partial [Armillaria borealis]
LLDSAFKAGCTLYDTANAYLDSSGNVSSILGRYIRDPDKRHSIFLATKFGFTMQGARGDPEYVKKQCYQFEAWCGLYIHLYYQHD